MGRMLEPGLDRHEWESEWASLEEELADGPADVLPELDDLVARMLDACGYAVSDPVAREGDDRDVIADFLAAREITRLLADPAADGSPGHDEELALGFCISEGIHARSARVPDDLAANTVDVDAADFDVARVRRNFYTSSSCGVCGKGALEAVAVEALPVESELRVTTA